MSERFRAFSFVDRITRRPAAASRVIYTVPPPSTRFPASLMAEAVGQLAAWSAMAQLDFAWRPVAGLAAESALSPRRRTRVQRSRSKPTSSVAIPRRWPTAAGLRSTAAVRSNWSTASGRCCRWKNSMRRRRYEPTSTRCCTAGAAPGRFTGVPRRSSHDPGTRAGQALSARCCRFRSSRARPTSTITFRAGRYFPARC